MKNNIDIQYIKGSLIFFLVCLVLAIGLYYVGDEFEISHQEAYQKSRNSLSASHAKYVKLVEDIDRIEQYTKKYDRYRESGLIGPERRLSWIETLEAVNEVLKLPRMAYALSPQEGYIKPKLKVDRNVILNSTPMNLDIDILHEEDIFAVFEGIESSIENLYTLDSCTISSKKALESTFSTKSANMAAKCLLRWITIDAKEK